jgi:hypothetical protein
METCCAIEFHVIYWCGDGKIIYMKYTKSLYIFTFNSKTQNHQSNLVF